MLACAIDREAASLMGITARTIYRREAEWAEEARGGSAERRDDD